MHATENLEEADRLMTVCNSCRYCEGLCAVFPAMEMRRSFADGDLNYLANLCHGCGACYVDCQFSPPHEFKVDVPRNLARVRADSYAAYAWPAALRGVFAYNGVATSVVIALAVAAFLFGFALVDAPSVAFGAHRGPGAFYAVMPHAAMAILFSLAFIYALVAMTMGVVNFLKDVGPPPAGAGASTVWEAIHDALRLRYLDGGGVGCYNKDELPTDNRRLYHHFTFYGFMLCFAATCVATLYHYAGREAPYAWYEPPVLLGVLGGVGLVIGTAGLFVAKMSRDPALAERAQLGMDLSFIAMLFLTGLTGLALLLLRDTAAMGALLAVHLGVVFALFVTMPYGKFVHGAYRLAALIRYSKEKRAFAQSSGEA
jgi:citrate/tricarballylate utilization protein